jgi:Ca2+-transporting ATPase
MFHTVSTEEVIARFTSDSSQGLTTSEVVRRHEQFGKNILPEPKKKSFLGRLVGYLKDFLTIILLAAAGISFIVGERKDAYVIFCIVPFA